MRNPIPNDPNDHLIYTTAGFGKAAIEFQANPKINSKAFTDKNAYKYLYGRIIKLIDSTNYDQELL